jgi:ubiquinone/menaquinone biosynthesis C-methylase UbiE
MRWLLDVPQRGGPPARLERILAARPGERILEIGPGTGQSAIRVARSVAPGGRVDVLDLQQEMLDAVTRRAARNHVTNLTATLGDSGSRLPYASESFNGAYLMSVLGEIPDREQALAELFRVLRPGGRLVIGEIIVDPDYVPPGRLKQLAQAAGFRLDQRSGSPLAYAARFSR